MDTTNLVAWLPFDVNATEDSCGNTWTAYGNPTVGTNGAINGNALQLDGSSYLQLNGSISLGGKDFTIRGLAKVETSNQQWYQGLFAFDRRGLRLICMELRTDRLLISIKNSEATVTGLSLTERFHWEIDYTHSDGVWRLFINGTQVYSRTSVLSRTTYSKVYVGSNGDTGDAIPYFWCGSIDEFQIYDGVALHTENFTPPTAADYFPCDVTLVADVQRKVKNALLTWRYENPGDANDLIIPSTVLTNLPATQSKTGTAFYQTAQARCFDLPATSEVWIKFDVYTTGSQRWRAYDGAYGYNSNQGANGATSRNDMSTLDFNVWANSNLVGYTSNAIRLNTLQTVLLHMVSGSSDGIIETWVDGSPMNSYTGDVNHGNNFTNIFLQSDGSGTFFSNVIISNAEIGLDENAQTGTIIRVDVQRRITNVVAVAADAQRRIANAETIIADTQRVISNNKIIFTPEIYASWIPGGAINFSPEIYASWVPEEPAATFIFDAQRRIINAETIIADTQRRVTFESQTFIFDAQRRIGNHLTITADTRRKITRTEKLTVDVQRRLEITATIAADTEVKINRSWLTRILPDSSFLDETFYASAKALDAKISDLFADTPEVLHLPRLNFLSGIILDVLAEQFHVDAYDAINFSDAEKRDLIRESIAWHRIKGTPAAVKMVLGGVFKDLRVPEWFEYGGEPYYFRLWCRGYTSTPERFKSFWNMFWDAKNVRSHLEKVTFDLSPDEPMRLYAGVGRINHGYKNILLPKPTDQNAFVYAGAAKIIRGTISLTTEIPELPSSDDPTLKLFVGNAKIIRGNIAVKMQDFTA